MNCNHKVLPKLNAWRGKRMGSWYLQIHTYRPLIVQTYPLRSKLVSWFVTQKFTFHIHNVVLIVKNTVTKDSARTKKCGQAGHDDHECDNEAKCANCNGDHPAYVRSCPKWKIEKEIIKVKYQKNIPFHEARQHVEGPVTDPSKNSYVTVSKSHQWTSNTQGKLNGHLQNYFATLGFLVMLRLATDLKSRLVTAWGNTNGKNVVFFRHPRWVGLFFNQQSVQNIVFWCLICLNARVKLNVNILGVWSKVKFRYRTRNTYYRPHIYSYISHWVVCQVLTNRYLM